MNNDKKYMFDLYEIAESILATLKKSPEVQQRKLTINKVINSIFQWMDEYYLPNKMRWCDKPSTSFLTWCKTMDLIPGEYDKKSAHQRVAQNLECQLNDLLIDVLPNKTWHMLSIKRSDHSSFMLMVGVDYRIYHYMENVHGKK